LSSSHCNSPRSVYPQVSRVHQVPFSCSASPDYLCCCLVTPPASLPLFLNSQVHRVWSSGLPHLSSHLTGIFETLLSHQQSSLHLTRQTLDMRILLFTSIITHLHCDTQPPNSIPINITKEYVLAGGHSYVAAVVPEFPARPSTDFDPMALPLRAL
jgi:hypothetical protein